ncbi:hypothetical protein A9Q93_12940 [Nonlabens dokdonensis]|uniref:Type I restriction modification DNA specificity domain-containing protein n=1 Tax=Nonlabens dokdonensis TaxID=328515 RepID=A0A1Z8AJD9_9FLAO|nr:restriction endonuclease subunit S [Nonlabens dokdonensis]OUS10454.1 hypothetical protein A9Q93_12940 [Nonlabens dokdonensis]
MEKQLIPILRFPDFQGKWEKVIISQIANKITDGTHDTPKPIKEGIPFLTAIHVKDGKIDFDNCYYLSEEEHNKIFKRCNPEYGDLLMVNIGAGTATSAMVNVNYEFSLKNVALIKPNKTKIYPSFFAQVQRKNSDRLRHQISSGGAQPFLSLKAIGKLKLNIPSFPEQQKIASFLSDIDDKITKLTKKKTLLEQYKKGIMQKIFNQELRFKDDNGNEFPKWSKNKIGNVFSSFKGKGIPKGDVISGGVNKCVLYGELYTTYNEVINKVVSSTNSEDGLKSQKGDLLIPSSTTTTGIDLANVTALNFDDVLLGGDIIVMRGKKEINNIFYAYYLSNYKKHQIASRAQGITIVHIYFNSIKDLEIDIPVIEEQTKVANFLSDIDVKIEALNTKIENSKAFKKGLLQKMFV